ncbi:MAG TPA: GxxExxY protein [Candidatus Saccharimonadales bacterium]|jgi:hypothetical protein|nr:GxxExxY protein [Candidatus Saccharimonadales bacterium]
MNTDSRPIPDSILMEGELTEKILGAAFKVQNKLGEGFLEKVYENSLSIELRKCGLKVECQKAFPVLFEGVAVGNYLKASGIRVGLLINFACPKLQYRRLVV